MFLLGSISAKSQILKPSGGEDLTPYNCGSEMVISWETNNFAGVVDIYLWSADCLEAVLIDNKQENSGEYRWIIPFSQQTGEKYKIIIKESEDNNKATLSNTYFTINKAMIDYSKIEFTTNNNPDWKISPNPIVNLINIKAVNTIENIRILDPVGKVVFATRPGALEASIDFSDHACGLYICELVFSDGMRSIKTFIK